MREFEMRQWADSLIKRGVQGMLTPGLALTLSLASCGGSDYMAQFPRHDASRTSHDGVGATADTPVDLAVFPDGGGPNEGPDGAIVDVAIGPDLDTDHPVIDASNEVAGRDFEENSGG
jgi:hypothetical protein